MHSSAVNAMKRNQELYAEFLDWLTISHSAETVNSYRWGLKVFIDWISGREKEVVMCKEKDFTAFGIYLKERRRIKNSTQASYFCSLRTFWRWLYRNELVGSDDSIIPIPKDNDKVHYPFALKDEIWKMTDLLDEFFPEHLRNKAIILFLYATGLRLSEMIAINVSQLDLNNKKAVAKTYKRQNHYREIYWDDKTNDLLKRWIETREKIMERGRCRSDALFISLATGNKGARICKWAVQRMFRRLRREAGIERHITAHSMRHGFGKRAVERNIHPRHLQLMLGHAKLNTTMFYMGVENKELEKVYRRKIG
jgi:site-specific recombinase XerD